VVTLDIALEVASPLAVGAADDEAVAVELAVAVALAMALG